MRKNTIPRPEHPKPQFRREKWMNLNGTWTYTFDPGKSGMHEGRELYNATGFENEILVPFCPESTLSGVKHTDFIEAMWYHRRISIPKEWHGQRVLLHFGAVDYECEAFIDGKSVGIHHGGTVSFYFDVTSQVQAGDEFDLVIRVLDELRTAAQPRGKQSARFKSHGCTYTRTTGIWQTVWLEAVSEYGLQSCQIIPDPDTQCFHFLPRLYSVRQDLNFRITVNDNDEIVGCTTIPCTSSAPVSVNVGAPKLWDPQNPFLYDIKFEVLDSAGKVLDCVSSYSGLRKIHIEGNRLFLNNKPLYIRFILDQGFYPDGIWTAPSDKALKHDIELAKNAGFNGARLHQKVFEERYHYWADRLGFLTWGESASWGCNPNRLTDARNFLSEWREIIVRDRNHPSIIAWTPFNETRYISNPAEHHRLHIDAYELSKALDPTRPVNDASGYIHVRTDLWTVHHYERPNLLLKMLAPETEDGVFHHWPEHEASYTGQPYINDEFGGLKWIPPSDRPHADNSWGYGDDLTSEQDFYELLNEEIEIMLQLDQLSGYCYTQLTDVEQEQNGIYNYDRSTKFDIKRIAAIFSRQPLWMQ